MTDPKEATRRLAGDYAARGNPDGWFEEFYARAGGDFRRVYWADLAPGPHLVAYLKAHPPAAGARAATVGCGLGDDAEALAAAGWATTAFDISPAAIAMCRKRYPDTDVDYLVADLFAHPPAWRRAFDLVYECNTIQILTGENRTRALQAIADLVRPGGVVLASCRSREPGEGLDVWPLALDRDEIDGFRRAGLTEVHFEAYDDDQDPPVPHFFAVYRREA
jgi:SAM-dependent methyltransferase